MADKDYDEGYEAGFEASAKAHRDLIRGVAETARAWAVSMGGNTPLAIVAGMLREIVEAKEKTPDA